MWLDGVMEITQTTQKTPWFPSASGRFIKTAKGNNVQVFDAVIEYRDGTKEVLGTFKLKRDALAAATEAFSRG